MEQLTRTIIHIRLVNRTANKYKTIIENMPIDLDLKRVLKHFKTKMACNGYIDGTVIILQGDQRDKVYNFLINEKIVNDKDNIMIHGK